MGNKVQRGQVTSGHSARKEVAELGYKSGFLNCRNFLFSKLLKVSEAPRLCL